MSGGVLTAVAATVGIVGCAAAVVGQAQTRGPGSASTSIGAAAVSTAVSAVAPGSPLALAGVSTSGIAGNWLQLPTTVPGSGASSAGTASTVVDVSAVSPLAADGIPKTAYLAYTRAAEREHRLQPSCGLTWPLLAAIGRVESDHGRFAGAILHTDGISTPPIIGIPLNGHGTALIRDTDNGRLDGDTVYDRAVGPMQFIPSTWAGWGVDADGNGVANPFDIFDATAAAADYLCAAGRDLTTTAGQIAAVRSYNDSDAYIQMVLELEQIYARQVGITVPVLPATGLEQAPAPTHLPPVNPGPPRAVRSPMRATLPDASSSVPSTGGSSSTGTSASSSSSTPGRPSTSTSASTSPSRPRPSSSSPTSSSGSSSSPSGSTSSGRPSGSSTSGPSSSPGSPSASKSPSTCRTPTSEASSTSPTPKPSSTSPTPTASSTSPTPTASSSSPAPKSSSSSPAPTCAPASDRSVH